MFENDGYCPSSAFLHYGETYKVSPLWGKTEEILGDRIDYMVYTKGGYSYKGGFIVDALKGGDETLGIEVATALKIFIPSCEYGDTGKKILCTDVINPAIIPAAIVEKDGKWICLDGAVITTFVFEDSRYLIAIQNLEEEVRVYIFKK